MRLNALTELGSNARKELVMLYAMLASFTSMNAELQSGGGLVTRAQNAGTVISVVVIGVVALVGILIFSQVYNALSIEEGDPMYQSSESIMEGFGSAIEFVPIILLVLLASVVIAVVQRMRM